MTASKHEGLTTEEIRELVSYDRDTGIFTSKTQRGRTQVGDVLGSRVYNGSLSIRLAGFRVQAHRLVYMYLGEEVPVTVIHKDGNLANNSRDNLASNKLHQLERDVLEPTQENLREWLNYDRDTGIFTVKKVPKHSSKKVGDTVGSVDKQSGYFRIKFDSKPYQAHRLAWVYEYGVEPENMLDHINHNKLDNSISNLRDVTNQENLKNRPMQKNNVTGYTGVNAYRDMWQAVIGIEGKTVHLGTFRTIEEAVQARGIAEKVLGFHDNHGKEINNG